MAGYKLWQGPCLEEMKRIPNNSVDLILADLPYEQTSNAWDTVIPFKPLWRQYLRVAKENAAICLTAKGQFMLDLILSQRELYRYEWVWNKNKAANFAHCNYRPLQSHEFVLVFYRKKPTYNPQMVKGKPYKQNRKEESVNGVAPNMTRGWRTESDGLRYPKTVLDVKLEAQRQLVHPTQKPIALMEYLVKTYSNPKDIVLDNCMGSGTTGVACMNTNRRFIGIESDPKYFAIAKSRIQQARQNHNQNLFDLST